MLMMELMTTREASAVRQHFSRFVDDVVRVSPQIVHRRHRDAFMAVSLEHMRYLVQGNRLTLEYSNPEPNCYVGTLWPLVLVDEGTSYEDLVAKLVEQALSYAQDYFEDFSFFMSSPKTREQLPFIVNVLLQEDAEGIAALIDGKLG
jgi:Antitoxin of toxin-antitoxin, RelE / RelB, TA system